MQQYTFTYAVCVLYGLFSPIVQARKNIAAGASREVIVIVISFAMVQNKDRKSHMFRSRRFAPVNTNSKCHTIPFDFFIGFD